FSQLFNLHADFNSIQIDTACKVLKTKIPIKGKFHGSLNIKGDFQSPIITGNIRSRESNIGNFSLNKIVATFNYAQRLLYIKADSESNKQELFRVDGIIPVDLSFRPTKERLLLSGLDLSLECKKIDMDFISSFTKEIERVSGRMSFKVLARGNPGNPAIQGSAYIDNGVIRIAKTGLEYHELRGHIQFNNNTIIIEELSLMGGEGKVNITGNISLKDFRPYRLNMDIKCGKFKVINTSLLSGVVDADLNIKGPLSHHFLTGTIKLIESNINFSEIKKRRPEEIEIIEAEATGEEKVTEKREDLPFFLNNLCIDLNIIVPGNNHVKFMGFDAEIKGELAFKKAKKEPFLIEGNIQTICGSYHVRGREFIIKEGKITFSGFPRMDANLNLKAVCKISKLTVIMLLNGTLNNPRIAFQSNPPRKQADIIASLFFGRPVNKLTKSEEIQLQETAMSIMGGLAADQVKGILGERFTPDTVDIKTDKGVGFEMGKYINEQLFLIYERKFGIETSDQMRVEYQLTDRFSINSQIGSEKTSGIDLFWILDY
ncbi:MAG: translocation/assembly module TamB domain-containing protein, partial [Thermodesulfobacteriota bacterium]|nr:translocation/assembly module TamB domain-containing protein [Thermodesulfobacteriota bacterium]